MTSTSACSRSSLLPSLAVQQLLPASQLATLQPLQRCCANSACSPSCVWACSPAQALQGLGLQGMQRLQLLLQEAHLLLPLLPPWWLARATL